MSQHGDTLSRISHDVTQGLLGSPKLSQQRYSVGSNSLYNEPLDRSQHVAGQLKQAEPSQHRRSVQSSGTWTTLSREAWSDQDEIDDREIFVDEYNRLAKRYNVRLLMPEDYNTDSSSISDRPVTWFSRILRRTSSAHSTKLKAERQLKHKRSISDISLRRASKTKNTLKDKSLQDLVRLCGLSLLYLPTDYAPCSLAIPTCFRATAQYLVQHGPAVPGVFRIPGSNNVVAALYKHYCAHGDEGDIAGTVRCPTLPQHIKYDVHDVASAFKRFLSGVPGGIIGSRALFDTFVSIQHQLRTEPELPAKKRDQIRSRLIALAIATVKSQYRRELICAVFGLLSMIGQAAESKSKGEEGESIQASDLMSYGPLGIVFGPLLIGDLLGDYTLRLPNPYGGLIVLPITPPKSRKEKQNERQKSNKSSHDTASFNTHIDKIKIVNDITEMLIVHWQDVVRIIKISQALRVVGKTRNVTVDVPKRPLLRASASEAFARDRWDYGANDPFESNQNDQPLADRNDIFSPRRRRSKSQPIFKKRLSVTKSTATLSKTVEERASEISVERGSLNAPSQEAMLPDALLNADIDYEPDILPSTTSANQNDPSKAAPRKCKSGSKLRNYGTKPDRILRLPRKQSTHSLPEKYALNHQEHSCSIGPLSPKLLSEEKILQHIEPDEWYRQVVSEPEFCSNDPGLQPTVPDEQFSPSTNSTLVQLRAGPLMTTGATTDLSNKASPQEDLASLAELARVLLREPEDSETKPLDTSIHDNENDKGSSDTETLLRNHISMSGRKDSSGSSFSSMHNPFPARITTVSQEHESSGSSSSPLSIFLSRRRGRSTKQSNLYMAPAKLPGSTNTTADVPKQYSRGKRPTTKLSEGSSVVVGHSKTVTQRREIDSLVRASPRGTVKALVAKFSLGASPFPLGRPTTKAAAADVRVNQESPKSSLVSPYTRNPPSSIRSQRSGISDKPAKEIRSPPQVDLHLNSPKKKSPFLTPASKEQSTSSTIKSSPSRVPRKLLETNAAPRDSPDNSHFQCSPPGRSMRSNPSVKVSKPIVKETCPAQPDISSTQIAHNHPVLPAGTVSPKKSLVSKRNNSELHGQIQALQRQLAAKTEEVRQLKQQLDTRENPDVGTLAENVMEARREIQFWKLRAELYEKQAEMMRKTSSRTDSSQNENRSAQGAGRLVQSKTNHSDDSGVAIDPSRRVLRTADGASSWYSQNSEDGGSSGSLYGFQSTISSSENGNWLEQTMRALRRTES